MFGYSSILLPQLKNEDSAIRINSSEESWIGEASIITMKKKRCVESKINFTLNYFFSSCDRLDPNGDRMHFGWCNNGKIWPETTIRAYERVVHDRLDDTVFQCKLLRLTTGSVRDGFLCGTSVAVRVRLHK